MMELSFDVIQQLVALLGPLVVGAITGLATSSKVKTALSVAITAVVVAADTYLSGGFTGDVYRSAITFIVTWQGLYLFLWKGTGLTAWLQDKVPIQLWGSGDTE